MECRHCGQCCTDTRININLSVGDIWRICAHKGISVDEFFEEFGGMRLFGDPRTPNEFDVDIGLNMPCPFRKEGRCSIYKARPANCRIFPYWVLVTVPEEKLPEVLKYNGFKYDLKNKPIYKEYSNAIGKVILEEAKWFDMDMKVKKNEKFLMPLPSNEVKEAIAKNLNKIKKNFYKLEKAEEIIRK